MVGHSPEVEMRPIVLIEDGDEITIDANAYLSLNISDDEMKRRLEDWKNPNSSPKAEQLANTKTVQSASNGAITD